MSKAALLFAIALLAACNSKPAPPNTSAAPASAPSTPAATPPTAPPSTAGDVQSKLREIAGRDATNCGDVKALSGTDVQSASDCAMQAAKAKKAFVVSYDMPGLSVGVAGNSDGKLFTVQTGEENGKSVAKSQPCPAELRIAQSGRVTCMPVGSMGVAPGSANPHAGGITTTPGAANPHAGAPAKSH